MVPLNRPVPSTSLWHIFMKEKTSDIISLLWVWFLCKKQPFSVLWQPFCIISIIEVDLMCAMSKQCQHDDYLGLKTLNLIVSQLQAYINFATIHRENNHKLSWHLLLWLQFHHMIATHNPSHQMVYDAKSLIIFSVWSKI